MQDKMQVEVCLRTESDGEPAESWYRSGYGTIRASIKKEKVGTRLRATLLFSEDESPMLTMIAEMDKPVEPSFPAQHRLTVKGQEVDYSISLDISSPPPLSVPSGKVEIVNKGQVWLVVCHA